MTPHSLDRPAWSALNSGWADRSERHGGAVRLLADYGPFVASADLSAASLADIVPLLTPGEESWLVETEPFALPGGNVTLSAKRCVQMVAQTIGDDEPSFEIVPLGETDAAEMRALALLTKPGPFRALTHRLGRFVGVRADGKLVAMAGERMRLDGHVELSGVCTHPDHRGRGYAGALLRHVARRILVDGDLPFLHAYASNTGAVALYEAIGFRTRATLMLTAITRG